MYTPWGNADSIKNIGRGILSISTPGHGGYFVPVNERAKMPAAALKTFAGGGWYEEDCDWCLVALSFPDLFDEPAIAAAVKTCEDWLTAEQCAAFGLKQSARNYKLVEAERIRLLDEGKWLRCSALGIDSNRVHVLFRNKAGANTGAYMLPSTYDAIPLMDNSTWEDYQRLEPDMKPAPNQFHYGR